MKYRFADCCFFCCYYLESGGGNEDYPRCKIRQVTVSPVGICDGYTTGVQMTTKTLFVFQEIPERTFFFELEGDYRRFDGVLINGPGKESDWKALSKLVYDKDGNVKVKELDKPSRDWDHCVVCGFIM